MEDDEVEDPFGQIGNFDMKLPGSNDSRFEIEGESFNFGGDDNRRLMDAEEKKFALSEDISISFSNLTTSENAVSHNLESLSLLLELFKRALTNN